MNGLMSLKKSKLLGTLTCHRNLSSKYKKIKLSLFLSRKQSLHSTFISKTR